MITTKQLAKEGIKTVNTCPTCTKSPSNPFRVYNENGTVRYGCIDDFHTGHLVPISESNRWHNRPEAQKHRRAVKEHLRTLKPYEEAK